MDKLDIYNFFSTNGIKIENTDVFFKFLNFINEKNNILNNTNKIKLHFVRYGKNKSQVLERVKFKNLNYLEFFNSAMNFFNKWYSTEQGLGIVYIDFDIIPRNIFEKIISFILLNVNQNSTIKIDMCEDNIIINAFLNTDITIDRKKLYLKTDCIFDLDKINDIYKHSFYEISNKNQFQLSKKNEKEEDYIQVDLVKNMFFIKIKSVKLNKDNLKKYIVYNAIFENHRLTRKQLEIITGLSRSYCGYILRDLIKEKKIEKIGLGRATFYRIYEEVGEEQNKEEKI